MTWKQLSLQKGEGKKKKKETNNQHGIKQTHTKHQKKEKQEGKNNEKKLFLETKNIFLINYHVFLD